MYTAKIRFETMEEAKAFVDICNEVDFKVELQDNVYVIDAKSIMGVFSLGLPAVLDMRAHCTDSAAFREKIQSFLVEE